MAVTLTLQRCSQHKSIPKNRQIDTWMRLILKKMRCTDVDITLRMVNPKESAALNAHYRQKTGATNVLSFVYESKPVWGDIVLCAPLIARQAKQQKKSVSAHWAHLIVHGCLHLLGYDHVKLKEAVKMERLEIKLLKALCLKKDQ